MILRMVVKLSLEENDGTVIKEQEYGNAYMENIDMPQAAEDWWLVRFGKKSKYPRHCFKVAKIADILTSQLKDYLLNKFLCDRDTIYEDYHK